MDNQAFDELLLEYDNTKNLDFSEGELGGKLAKLSDTRAYQSDFSVIAEAIAFTLYEVRLANLKKSEPFYQPTRMTFNDGRVIEKPSLKLITPEVIEYWEGRISAAQNPILVGRYSGLVWVFKNEITGTQPNVAVCRTHIQSMLALTKADRQKFVGFDFQKLSRAIALARTINDAELINQSIAAIISKENSVTDDTKPGLWGYAIDLLSGPSKKTVTAEQETQIILALEGRLSRLMTAENTSGRADPWSAERAVIKLADYYRKKAPDELRRVVLSLGTAFHNMSDGASAMQTASWLERLYKIYSQFNLKEEAKIILVELRAVAPKMKDEMGVISTPMEFPKEAMDEYVRSILDGTFEKALLNLTLQHVPSRMDAKEALEKLAEQTALLMHMGHDLQDDKGRVVARVGTLENDLEGHIVLEKASLMKRDALPLAMVFQGLIAKFNPTPQMFVGYIKQSPVFEDNRTEILRKGFESYLAREYMVAIHLLIPQIEEAVRNLIQIGGGNVLKEGKRGGFSLRTLDDLLNDPFLVELLGDDISAYLKIVLTDQRGWNLRNDVAHGIAGTSVFSEFVANRVVHAILCFGLLRPDTIDE